jgi:hypothetical protein
MSSSASRFPLTPPCAILQSRTAAQLDVMQHDYFVFFPRILKWFRPVEKMLTWCPLGAQYAVVSAPDGGK